MCTQVWQLLAHYYACQEACEPPVRSLTIRVAEWLSMYVKVAESREYQLFTAGMISRGRDSKPIALRKFTSQL